MKPLVIYHGNCADGFTAAWVANRYFAGEVDLHAGVYQTPPPDVTDREMTAPFPMGVPVVARLRLRRPRRASRRRAGTRPRARKMAGCATPLKAVRVWGDTMTGDGADGETMYPLRRAIQGHTSTTRGQHDE